MPAAAVIPALIAYIKVVAVKKLVVGSRGGSLGPVYNRELLVRPPSVWRRSTSRFIAGVDRIQYLYFEQIRVFKAGFLPEYISME